MDLKDFLRETQAEVRTQMKDGSPFAELIFSEIVMQHMSDIGMTEIQEPIAMLAARIKVSVWSKPWWRSC